MVLKSAVLCLLIFSSVTHAVPYSIKSLEDSWPADLTKPFPYRTLEPIDIDTSSAKLVNVSKPLTLIVSASELHNLTNTGCSVEVTINTSLPKTLVTGGPLGNDTYVFYKLTYYWAGAYTDAASGTTDGTSTPLESRTVFRNLKYPTFEEAVCHRDGLAVLVADLVVEGYAPNPAFIPFSNKLASIRKPGSRVLITSIPVFSWFNEIPLVQYYYAFPGAYIDKKNSAQYDCATIIVSPKGYAFAISIPQFAYFQNLTNYAGTPLTNALTSYPAGRRPIVQICGTAEIIRL